MQLDSHFKTPSKYYGQIESWQYVKQLMRFDKSQVRKFKKVIRLERVSLGHPASNANRQSQIRKRIICDCNQQDLYRISDIFAFICCFVILILFQKGISPKYLFVTVCFTFLYAHLIAFCAIPSHFYFFESVLPESNWKITPCYQLNERK